MELFYVISLNRWPTNSLSLSPLTTEKNSSVLPLIIYFPFPLLLLVF